MDDGRQICTACGADATNRARCPSCGRINTAFLNSGRAGGVFVSVMGAALLIVLGVGFAIAARGLKTGDALPMGIQAIGLTFALAGVMWLVPLLVSVRRGARWFGRVQVDRHGRVKPEFRDGGAGRDPGGGTGPTGA